jgi:hypothetical protein
MAEAMESAGPAQGPERKLELDHSTNKHEKEPVRGVTFLDAMEPAHGPSESDDSRGENDDDVEDEDAPNVDYSPVLESGFPEIKVSELERERLIKCGWLSKLGERGRKVWKKRWFVLRQNQVTYYKDNSVRFGSS